MEEIPQSVFCFTLPPGLPCLWTARAIYSTRPEIQIDLLPDRMHSYGDIYSTESKNLHAWLHLDGIPELQELCIEQEIAVNDCRHVEHTSSGFIIRATPNGSHGYLYIVGYPLPQK